MADLQTDSQEIKETDIVFDCPHCGKSLAIDYRGAGLSIPCSDCGRDVDVPIPEGMEVTDIDGTEEEQEMRILNLRRTLHDADSRIAQLEARVEALEGENASLAEGDGSRKEKFNGISKSVEHMRRSLDELSSSLRMIEMQLQGTDEDG
jgi:transcription elongation factor Elf1